MYIPIILISLPILGVFAECNTPGYVPCPPSSFQGSASGSTLPPAVLGGGINIPTPAGSNPVVDAGGDGIQAPPPSVKRDGLFVRQNALCCKPAPVECRIWTEYNVPFCYTPATTRWFFSDGSYFFQNNGTYVSADGTVSQVGNVAATSGAAESGASATSSTAAISSAPGTKSTAAQRSASSLTAASSGTTSTSSGTSPTSSGTTPTSSATSPTSSGTTPTSPSARATSSQAKGSGAVVIGYKFMQMGAPTLAILMLMGLGAM